MILFSQRLYDFGEKIDQLIIECILWLERRSKHGY